VAVSVSLARAPLVIKQRKVTKINLDPLNRNVRAGRRDTLVLDMRDQGIEDIQFIMKEIARQESRIEIRKDNPPTRLVVDNREGKQAQLAERKIEVFFGNFLDQKMVDLVQRSLMQAIRSAGLVGSAGIKSISTIDSISNWQWLFMEKAGGTAAPINIKSLANLPEGASLFLMPKSIEAGVMNMVAARIDAGWPRNRLYYSRKKRTVDQSAPSTHRSRGKGFMAKAVGDIKRSRLMKNYTMRVVFSGPGHSLSDEKYGRGTPVIVIKAKRLSGRSGAGRAYRKFV